MTAYRVYKVFVCGNVYEGFETSDRSNRGQAELEIVAPYTVHEVLARNYVIPDEVKVSELRFEHDDMFVRVYDKRTGIQVAELVEMRYG